ncbi:AraC family transcriptional regulator [Neisseria yangbaofengii]|nr:AraC family transcriptional regulator [Neisseria yangbaofengii]
MFGELADCLGKHTTPIGGFFETALPCITLCRRNHSTEPMPCIYPLSLFVVVQGSQHINFGNTVMTLSAGQSALTTLDLPVVSNVLNASTDKPYLSVRIELDVMLLRKLDEQTAWQTTSSAVSDSLSVFEIDDELLGAVLRLVKLLDNPTLQPHLAPLIEQEIALRILASPHLPMLRRLFHNGTVEQKIAKTIAYFNKHYADKIDITHLANEHSMSASSFREHFKKITGVSPLQYQKQLRLQQARRLMFKQNIDATTAAYEVGYGSVSQFNREYARLFGEPPLRDIQRLKDDEMNFGRIV